MPPNKSSNKGKKASHKKSRPAKQPTPAARGDGQQPLLQRIKNKLPSFHQKKKVTPGTVEPIGGGYYELYKDATSKFYNWMAHEACPDFKMTAVNDYRKGVDRIVDSNLKVYMKKDGLRFEDLIVAPREIMTSLASSIQLRKRFTSDYFGSKDGGDLGHRYVIEVLHYCQTTLLFGNRIAAVCKANNGDEGERVHDAIGGRFNALTLDDDLEEEEDIMDWENIDRDIKNGKVPKYTGVEVNDDIDIKEALLKGDDRFQAMALLHTMDDFMESVHGHYDLLKAYIRGNANTHKNSSCVQLLMECAMMANAATESVNRAENQLSIDHPHLSSFYRVLALIKMPEPIADINNLIKKSKLEADPHMGLQFVADIVECSFHNRGQERVPPIVKRFVKKSGLDSRYVDETSQQIFLLTAADVLLKFEERLNPGLAVAMSASGLKPHTWLHPSEFIGGDCCILNTQKIVQMLMDILQDEERLVGRPGFWGQPFDENKRPARQMWRDLDEAFAASIMPELIEICRHVPFHCLPDLAHLITVLDLLRRHVKGDRTQPVPIALTFGLHAVLMSIFVLQGDGDLDRLAAYSKQSYHTLFEQLRTVSDSSKSPLNSPKFYLNVLMFSNLAGFAKPVPIIKVDESQTTVDPLAAERLAFWNPLIGGEYMLYATYICSIGLGSATVDSLGQLRFALHLYNGLKIRDPTLDVPFLRNMDTVFKDTKAVWVGGKPERGLCCKVFWMSWGMSASRASRKASEHVRNNDIFSVDSRNGADDIRELDEIPPEEFSASYQRLVQQDFESEDLANHYTNRNRNSKSSDGTPGAKKHYDLLVDLLTRVNITRDAMDDDERTVLPVNFSAVGSILLEFVNALSDHMGWSSLVLDIFRNNPELRSGKTMKGSTLKGFTASDLNFKLQGLSHFWGHLLSALDRDYTDQLSPVFDMDEIAAFTKSFFDKVEKSRYIFFVEEEAATTVSKRRNPLEGSYPFGRTGRSMRDPLQGYWSYSYSKRGNPVSRIIFPGRLTPLKVSALYQGEKKLKQGPRGKYRHIASYSLDELLDLDWDGSLYVPKHENHEAYGYHVPFIPGYDSDSADEYEPIDIQRGKQQGTIGLSDAHDGLYMEILHNDEPQSIQLNAGIKG